jgi:hypothetical protein
LEKQEPQLVQKLNNLQELLPLRVLLKSNNLEAAEIEVKLLVEKGLLSTEAKIEQFSYDIYAYDNVLEQYYVKEIQLGYKAIDQLNLKEILPNFVLPFGTLEDDLWRPQLLDPEIPLEVKNLIVETRPNLIS